MPLFRERAIYSSSLMISKGDKAREAAKLGEQLLTRGLKIHEARHETAHELQHALADTKPGYFKVVRYFLLIFPTPLIQAIYLPDGGRTLEEAIKILSAPEKLSPSDERKIKKFKEMLSDK